MTASFTLSVAWAPPLGYGKGRVRASGVLPPLAHPATLEFLRAYRASTLPSKSLHQRVNDFSYWVKSFVSASLRSWLLGFHAEKPSVGPEAWRAEKLSIRSGK